MNPLTLWKLYRKANDIADQLQEAKMGKVAWKSKVLWFNVLTGAASMLGLIPLDPHTTLIASGAINAVLRLLTNQPITFQADQQ